MLRFNSRGETPRYITPVAINSVLPAGTVLYFTTGLDADGTSITLHREHESGQDHTKPDGSYMWFGTAADIALFLALNNIRQVQT